MSNSAKTLKELYPKFVSFIKNPDSSNKIELKNPEEIFQCENWKNLSFEDQMNFLEWVEYWEKENYLSEYTEIEKIIESPYIHLGKMVSIYKREFDIKKDKISPYYIKEMIFKKEKNIYQELEELENKGEKLKFLRYKKMELKAEYNEDIKPLNKGEKRQKEINDEVLNFIDDQIEYLRNSIDEPETNKPKNKLTHKQQYLLLEELGIIDFIRKEYELNNSHLAELIGYIIDKTPDRGLLTYIKDYQNPPDSKRNCRTRENYDKLIQVFQDVKMEKLINNIQEKLNRLE